MAFKPVPMSRIAILGLRKYRQPAISLLHDLEVLQIEPLSKDVSTLMRTERDSEISREMSNQLLRVRSLLTVLPRIPVTVSKRFESTNELLKTCNSIDIDEQVASFEKEKETLLTEKKRYRE